MHRRVFGFENVRIDDFSERSNPIIRHWFLTHFHADHYAGLSKQLLSPQQSTLYCSPITSKLVQAELGVPITKIHTIRIGKPVVLKELDVCVVAIDANHCPGSVMFLFENLESGERALHTGDMRYSPKMKLYKELENVKIHTLYLDTTYCSPKHVFPSQEKCVEQIVQIVKDLWEDQQVLFLIGTYKIGKERILVELCRVLKCRIYAPKDKYELLQMMEFNMDCFTMSEGKSRIHMVRIGELSWNCLDAIRAKYPNYKRIIGFRPTGWTFTSSKDCTKTEKGNVTIYGIPYSEHSSFSELQEFVKFIKPQKLIPTVHNGDKENIEKIVSHFQSFLDHSLDKNKIASYFIRHETKSEKIVIDLDAEPDPNTLDAYFESTSTSTSISITTNNPSIENRLPSNNSTLSQPKPSNSTSTKPTSKKKQKTLPLKGQCSIKSYFSA